jgi:AraC-like DNA-binding protein
MRTAEGHAEVAATPMAFVHAILRAYRRYGVDPAGVLRQAQIAPADLARLEARITAGQLETLTAGAMQQLDDEALGWFSRRLPWGSLGMLCRASLTAPTLGVALRRWFRHHRLLTPDLELELSQPAPGVAVVSLGEARPLGDLREFCLLSYLRFVHGYACWAVDSRISLLGVGLPFARPVHGDVYPLLFPGPVSFDAERAHLTFDARYLALPQRRDDQAAHLMLERALPLTVRQYRRDRLLVRRVQRLLREDPARAHDAPAIAQLLHVSVRTLFRQLAQEGASLQALKDEARRERAEALLERTQKRVKQVALAVGFESEKSFARAFKGWTGLSPRQLRARSALPE